ncbi:MAG: family 10 glycosylhydrolase [Cyanobacteriota bacterium]|nr:family 10 glycosylhydrolase [Cyanobacteriota bacterium]
MSPNGQLVLLLCLWLSCSTLTAGAYGWLRFRQNLDLFALFLAPAPAPLEPLSDFRFSDPAPPPPPITLRPSPLAVKPPASLAPKTVNPKPASSFPPVAAAVNPSPDLKPSQTGIRGLYLSRYAITNNASEAQIRSQVRRYKALGVNTLIHGVWGNGCAMYRSAALKTRLGLASCPNQFDPQWLDWLIDEAHRQGMEVHAYFEKGIKLDRNSPIFEEARAKGWLAPGVDRTYAGVEHYILDVANPEIAGLFRDVLVEFVQKYPQIDAVQWDDYLGYHSETPSPPERIRALTQFVTGMLGAAKKANPRVKFDLCHHNPYWAKRYFAADWPNWPVDRVFIQAYNDDNFSAELAYAQRYRGISLTEHQAHRFPEVFKSPEIRHIFLFPLAGAPEQTARLFQRLADNPP